MYGDPNITTCSQSGDGLQHDESVAYPRVENMATYITDDCINCGACEPECPNEAITEGEEIYEIDPKLCTECVGFHEYEACQAICPVECCLPNPDIVETEALLAKRAVQLHPQDVNLKTLIDSGDFPSRFRA